MELIVFKKGVVRLKENVGSALVLRLLCCVADQFTTLKLCCAHQSVAVGTDLEMRAQEVDGLDAHAVHTHRLFESLGIVFTTRVELAHGLNHLLLRDAASIVAERYAKIIFDINLYALAFVHAELIDGIIDGLLQQYIDAVFRL